MNSEQDDERSVATKPIRELVLATTKNYKR
jgi:hypothetical protein